jgi:hypothetical protein
MPKTTPNLHVQSWFNDCHRHVASDVYSGFYLRWSKNEWASAIKSAVYWYLFGNAPGVSVENGIILAHVAFETLGWTLFVEELKSLSVSGFRSLAASDKLRLLLNHCGIPQDVPTSLPSLQASAKAENWVDGPESISRIRNACVHPSQKNREALSRVGVDAQHEIWILSMHYLELILLSLFDYGGDYSCRVFGGAVQRVPWESSSP